MTAILIVLAVIVVVAVVGGVANGRNRAHANAYLADKHRQEKRNR